MIVNILDATELYNLKKKMFKMFQPQLHIGNNKTN